MPDLILHEWIQVNQNMRDDYRLLVATMAARQLKTVEPELQTLAREAFSAIPVPGARSFFKGDLLQQRKALAKTMQTEPHVAALVIALWAHAAESQINLLKQAGEQAGLQFDDTWDWHKGMNGFYTFEDIPVLAALADGLGAHTSEQDYDHLKLAALWLGPAATNPDALIAPTVDETATEAVQDSESVAGDA
ncbi:MAG: hypothetical protein HY741_03915 [Chloroflexi bacterium]|nr:hypothetical protein [Chloroflexota bacterium]